MKNIEDVEKEVQEKLRKKLMNAVREKNPKFSNEYINTIFETTSYQDIIDEYEIDTMRVCSHCGKLMDEGYCIESGIDYYCSDECLHANMTEEEYLDLYNDGKGDSYYTEWY